MHFGINASTPCHIVHSDSLKGAVSTGQRPTKKRALQQCLHMQVPNEMATQYQDVLSAQDVAVYGGLCALASFDRSDLRSYVINNVSFRDYMEVNPEVMLTAYLRA